MKTRHFLFFTTAFWIMLLMKVYGLDCPDRKPGELCVWSIESVNDVRAQLEEILSKVPAGTEGQSSPWFAKLQVIKDKLDQVASSKAQTDLFGLVPHLADVFLERDPPYFFSKSFGVLANLSVDLLYSIAYHVNEQSGMVTSETLTNFVIIFAVGDGFISEANWEDRPIPIDEAGVMILDATAVVSQLKSGPWQQARHFLLGGGDATPSEFFARYTENGDGLEVLKAKYAANQAVIDAKFYELKEWVEQQQALEPPPPEEDEELEEVED